MTKIFFATLITLFSTAALAQPIALKPGSTVVINGDVVSCQGPSEEMMPLACVIKQDGMYYRLFVGPTIAESFRSFNEALDAAKEMKTAGFCR